MDLFRNITPQTTLLTPNSRIAATYGKKYHAFQLEQGLTSWSSLDILPLSSWRQRLWNQWSIQQTDAPMVLTSDQETLLWEEILAQSPQNDYLLQVSKTAEMAKSAWSLVKSYCLDINDPIFLTTEDGAAFQAWSLQFVKLCQERHWIDAASIADRLTEQARAGKITPPKQIVLIGFTEIAPQDQRLINHFNQQGCTVSTYQLSQDHGKQYRIDFVDQEAEIRAAACWAKQQLENHTGDQTIRIGCVFPTLDKLRDKVIQIFSAVFSPENKYTLNHTLLPFNISAGKRLSEYPVIHAALELLNLDTDKVPLATLSNILRSPFLGEADSEMLLRANLDSQLRRKNMSVLSLETIANEKLALGERFKQFLALKASLSGAQPISKWVAHFMELLNTLGWPGERSLNSPEYQVVKNWLGLLTQYSRYDVILPSLTAKKALSYLQRLTHRKIFQPESPEAPVQILGILEAAELPFDALWVTGMDDTAWPTPPQPNPFIPQKLQKALQLPRATAEREFEFCQQLTAQLKASAPTVLFSHLKQSAETELRPSALISQLPTIHLDTLSISAHISPAQRIQQHADIEILLDDKAPAVASNETVRGGVSIIKQQAACPFKAFAEYRLNAKVLEAPTLGLSPQERGTIMHKALELTWTQIKNHQTLNSLPDDDLKAIIQKQVKLALTSIVSESKIAARYYQLEIQRLNSILWKWLQIEKERPPFTVMAQEQEMQVTIANMPLTIRIDRVDEVGHGKQLIIDYKTGKSNEKSFWFGERPDEPQLPLYCITKPNNTVGIAFAELHPEKMTLNGVSEYDLEIAQVKPLSSIKYADNTDWREQIKHWHTVIEQLGQQFCSGDAQVDPKEPSTCEYCHLQSLCRIYEY